MSLIDMLRRATGARVEKTGPTPPAQVLRIEQPAPPASSSPPASVRQSVDSTPSGVSGDDEPEPTVVPGSAAQSRPALSLTTPQQALYRALREAALRGDSVLVVGPASTGVSHVAREVSESRKQYATRVVLTGQEEAPDLLGRRIEGADGVSRPYEDSDFSRALAHGGYVLIEGLEKATPRVRDLLAHVLAEREVPRGFGRSPFKVHRNTSMVAVAREVRLDIWHPALLRKVFGLIVEVRDPEHTACGLPPGVTGVTISDVLTADDHYRFVRSYAPEMGEAQARRVAVLHESMCRFAASQPRLQASFDGMTLRRLCDLLRDVPADQEEIAFRDQSRTLYGACDVRACELVERLVGMLAP